MKKIIINVILTFALCFLAHNIYKWIPNNITAIFFPVNESIWEHMKMLYTVFLITGLVNCFWIYKENNLLSSLIVSILSIIIYLILFLPFNSENMVLIFGILILDIIICEYLRFKLITQFNLKKFNTLAFFTIIILYVVFGYLTYKPIHIDLFKDNTKNLYGINTYII